MTHLHRKFGAVVKACIVLCFSLVVPVHAQNAGMLVYVGTYTGPKSKGIYVMRMDPGTGALSEPEVAAEVASPSFLAIHPSDKLLYAVSEVGGKGGGFLSGFSIEAGTGKLTAINQQPSGGDAPCFVSIDKAGKNALVANYGSGTIESLPIENDGKLGQPSPPIQHKGKSSDPGRQEGPHAHSINLDAANSFAFAADLGLDEVLIYRFDAATGALTPNDPAFARVAPGSGPRHFSFHPNGKFAYVINELASTVTAFSYDGEKGALTEIQTITTLPADFKGKSYCAEVQVHPSGKFLYGSNRGHDSLAIYAIDEQSGRLTAAGHALMGGKTPRNFRMDPSGKFLLAANQSSDSVVVFSVDQETGALKATGASAKVGSPVCIKFLVVK